MELRHEIDRVLSLPVRAGGAVASAAGTALGEAARAIPAHRTLDAAQRIHLRSLALASTNRPWNLTSARNAHATNTAAQMEHALRGPYDVLEGDLRVDRSGRLVMEHDPIQANGLTFADWLDLAVRSGRGVKIDVKEPEAIVEMLREVERSGVPHNRLILNIPVGTKGATSTSVGHLQLIRTHFPDATVNLSNQRYPHDASQLQQLGAVADYLGGRVMFPVRADQVTAKLTRSLEPHGRVAAWNEPWFGDVASIGAERRRLRRLGVDGTIDLRQRPEHGAVRTLMGVRDHAAEAADRARGWFA